jgi:2,4-dienoyl-CoA reductase (NADPH2)
MREMLTGLVSPADAARLPAWQRIGSIAAGVLGGRLANPAVLRAATRRWMPLGRRVAVVGADLAAVELAEFLAGLGREVALLDDGDVMAPEVGAKRRAEHMVRLDRLGVTVNLGAVPLRITGSGLDCRFSGGREDTVEADSVVLAGRLEADPSLAEALVDQGAEVHAIGDCTGLGLIRGAVADAMRVARAI